MGSVLVIALGELGSGAGSAAGSAAAAAASDKQRWLLQGTVALLAQAFANASYILLQRKLLRPPHSFPVLTLTACGFVVAAVRAPEPPPCARSPRLLRKPALKRIFTRCRCA